MELVIFGAWATAVGVYDALSTLCPRMSVRCFLVSRTEGNPAVLRSLPVKELDAFTSECTPAEKQNIRTLIATPEDTQTEIEALLDEHGFPYHVRVDSLCWAEWMKLLYVRLGKFPSLSAFPAGCHAPSVKMYMVKSDHDRPLRNPLSRIPTYVVPIYAGAAWARCEINGLTDASGDNISRKNGNYSELTALYWIWKNKLLSGEKADAAREYYGLSQYRRIFSFQRDDLLRLADNEIDAVLPYPLPHEPDISIHHRRYLKEKDWDAMLTALRELRPADAAFLSEMISQPYLYPYNLILAEKRVLRDYCEWLFPVLERIERLSVPRGNERSDRYIGYMAETLETLYFMRHSNTLNIVHAGCQMLT